MNIINSWKSDVKQTDKIDITFRVSKLTLFELNIDLSNKAFRIVLFNIGLEI